MNQLDPVQAAYLAGFIDGDGYIAKGRFVIRIYQKDRVVLDWIQSTLDSGTIRSRTRSKTNNLHMGGEVFNLSIQGRFQCKHLLEQILPYLVVKKQRGLDLYEHTKIAS